ncbi:MAG TPA: bifunctional adenosylcobinamide kinase/adenosylcobinamide-phosphate guanylyltransferase, partial [Paraburkholderia sp.]|nr:bifunctional adenosylcobinamide kinase/adenosylcobinamide-phosphate guanylyltransferase [Paraburkholderia sp.]
SGKSAHAERLASDSARPVTYIATARVADDEFAARVALHRSRRPSHWLLVEAPLDLAGAVAAADAPGQCVLIDCLTLWLANLLCPPDGDAAGAVAPGAVAPGAVAPGCDVPGADVPHADVPRVDARRTDAPRADYAARIDAFDAALAAAAGKVIVVTNEIGLGVVPLGAATRLYVDELGRLNQRIAARAAGVTMMVAGLPLALKTASR